MAMRRAALVLLVVVLGIVLLYSPNRLPSCSLSKAAVFTFARDLSFDAAAKGQWEVLGPSYRRISLIFAYRSLSGLRPSQADLEAFREVSLPPSPEAERAHSPRPDVWLPARWKATGVAPAFWISVYRQQGGNYSSYVNCLDDAFQTAARTLEDRMRQFGAKSPMVAEWVRGQDQVFQNCGGGPAVIPAAAGPDLPAMIRADRAYQIAAAHFYAGDFEQAESLFREIARDSSSPWRLTARYVAVRCIIRRATLVERGPDLTLLARAETEFEEILRDASLQAIHEPARKLLLSVLIRLHPMERMLAASRGLTKPKPGEDLTESLKDYRYLLDRLRYKGPESLREATTADDLTDWIITFEARGSSASGHAYEKWEATSSLPWLVAAMAETRPDDTRTQELLSAARSVKPGSPAFPTVSFHTVRLLTGMGRQDEARTALDALLSAKGRSLSVSAKNLFLAQRLRLARSLDEFLRDAPRLSVGGEYGGDPSLPGFALPPEQLFDADAAMILTQKLPLTVLVKAASSGLLPPRLRREVTLATWARAVLLGEDATAVGIASSATLVEPALKADLSGYVAAKNLEDRKFAAAFAMLRSPGITPSVNENLLREAPVNRRADFREQNWWCVLNRPPEAALELNPSLLLVYPRAQVESPAFQTDSEKVQAAKEWASLVSLAPAGSYLAREAIAYARTHPNDPRVPDSLHLAVRATRYGCSDAETGKFSKQAFDLLHQRYAKTPWAQETPYWYR